MIVAIIIIGLCLGSFVNALVWRLHEKKDWVKARSQCVNCNHELAALDLIPIVSWIFLKGKCRYCHKPISVQYPIVELTLAILFLLSFVYWPVALNGWHITVFVIWLMVLTGLIALAVYDLRWMLLPTKLIYSLLIFAVIMAVINIIGSPNHLNSLAGYLEGTIVGGGIFFLIFQISKGKWIGGGDVRLGFLLGLLASTALRSFLLIFIASLIGTIVSIILMSASKLKKSSLIPFGPFLIASIIIIQLAGTDIFQLYSKIFLGN